MRPRRLRTARSFSVADEEAGAREPFADAVLYDFEYRRRRADVNFYRRVAEERLDFGGGPVLDLACGTGRLMVPLLRDGHTVLGLDHAAAMLTRAAWRLRRLGPTRRARTMLMRADMRNFALAPRFGLAICAFHSLQHLVSDDDLVACMRSVAGALVPGGWFAFDLLPPDPAWIARDPARRWARTVFRHPVSGQRMVYTTNHVYDRARQALHMRLYYQPLDAAGQPAGRERLMRLCHRQLDPPTVKALLERAGFDLVTSFGAFDGRPLSGKNAGDGPESDVDQQHIYVARSRRRTSIRAPKSPRREGRSPSRKRVRESP
jgi:SAM-dependent methyltransferase